MNYSNFILFLLLLMGSCIGIDHMDSSRMLIENNSNHGIAVILYYQGSNSGYDFELANGEDTTLSFTGPAGAVVSEFDSVMVFFDTLKVSKYYRENLPSDSLNRSLLNKDSYIIEEGDRQKGAKGWHLTYTFTPADFIRADTIE